MQENEQLQSVVYFLSDHLCSAVETGEDIFTLRYASQNVSQDMTTEDILDRLDEFHQFLDEIRTHEYIFLSKINQARHWCIHLRHLDAEFRPVVDLFNTATKSVADVETVLGMDERGVFDGQATNQHLIESRNLYIDPPHSHQGQPNRIAVDENFLLGGKAPLVDLLDACNTFLDSLDIRYDVIEEVDDAAALEDASMAAVEHSEENHETELLEAKSGS